MIEYALLAPVFFILVMGMVEFVLYQYRAHALNHVVYEAARNLQTGEVQGSATAEMTPEEKADAMSEAFHDEVCAKAGGMLDCEAIVFDVRNYDEIDEIEFPEPEFDEDGNPINFVFEPGGANQFSVVRASVHHTFITPFMAEMFQMGPDQPAIVNAFCIVQNEPWT